MAHSVSYFDLSCRDFALHSLAHERVTDFPTPQERGNDVGEASKRSLHPVDKSKASADLPVRWGGGAGGGLVPRTVLRIFLPANGSERSRYFGKLHHRYRLTVGDAVFRR